MNKKIDLAKSEIPVVRTFQEFTQNASAGGIVLIVCTLIAMIWANSPWWHSYFELWETHVSVGFGHFEISKTLHHWINDLLMVVFFFYVGLEIKREVLVGELSSIKNAMLPIMGALGGVIFPALIYVFINLGTDNLHGWAIPMATDIAFALGVLSLLGDRVPSSLKIFLAALAIVDDIAAVVVIAVFYTSTINLFALLISFFFIVIMIIGNRLKIINPVFYLTIGGIVWFAMLKSGVHSTIAGVLTAFTIPSFALIDKKEFVDKTENLWETFKSKLFQNKTEFLSEQQSDALYNIDLMSDKVQPLLHRLEKNIDIYVAFFIMPIFALSNAGIHFNNFTMNTVFNPVTIGIVAGLFIGKQLGVTLFVWAANKLGIARIPAHIKFSKIYYVSILTGIGFTMSLFVSGLSFDSGDPQTVFSKTGILIASILSGFVGYVLLYKSAGKTKKKTA